MAIKLVSVQIDANLFPINATAYRASEPYEVAADALEHGGTLLGQSVIERDGRLFMLYTVRVDD